MDYARDVTCALHRVVGARGGPAVDSGRLVEAVIRRVGDMLCVERKRDPLEEE